MKKISNYSTCSPTGWQWLRQLPLTLESFFDMEFQIGFCPSWNYNIMYATKVAFEIVGHISFHDKNSQYT